MPPLYFVPSRPSRVTTRLQSQFSYSGINAHPLPSRRRVPSHNTTTLFPLSPSTSGASHSLESSRSTPSPPTNSLHHKTTFVLSLSPSFDPRIPSFELLNHASYSHSTCNSIINHGAPTKPTTTTATTARWCARSNRSTTSYCT